MPNDAGPIDWVPRTAGKAPALVRAASAQQALAARRSLGPGAVFVAGATALQLAWGVAEEESPDASHLVDLLGGALPAGIDDVILPDGTLALRVGAAARLESLRRDPRLRAWVPRLCDAIDAIASPGVRNLATLGGNIGWRCGDALPALLASQARAGLAEGGVAPLVEILDAARRDPAGDLPLIEAVFLPKGSSAHAGGWSVFEKVGWRATFSPSRLTLAVEASEQGGRIATARVAATAAGWPARRLPSVEAWLIGRAVAALRVDAPALSAACLADLGDASRARLAARLLTGHLAREA